MSYSPFVQPHSSALDLHQELRHEDLPQDSAALPAAVAPDSGVESRGSLLTASGRGRARTQSAFKDKPAEEASAAPAGGEIYSLFRHRKQDSISSDTRDVPSCRSDDASRSSESLQSVGSGGPPSPMDKLGSHDFSNYPSSSTTIHAHQTSTPLNLDMFNSSANCFDFGNYNADAGALDFIHTDLTDQNQHILSPGFDFGDSTDSAHLLKPPDDGLRDDQGPEDTSQRDASFSGGIDDISAMEIQLPEHEDQVSPSELMSFTFNQQQVDTANEKLMTELQFDPNLSRGAEDYAGLDTSNTFCGDVKPAASLSNAQSRFQQPPPPQTQRSQHQSQHLPQRQLHPQQARFDRLHHLQPHQQFRQQQPQSQGQPQPQPQPQMQLHQQHQAGFSDPSRQGLAIHVPATPSHDQQMLPDHFMPQQPLLPLSTPLHTQLNPPLGHVSRFPDQPDSILSRSDRVTSGHSRQGSITAGHQRPSGQFRSMPSKRMHHLPGPGATEYFHNGFPGDSSTLDSMPMFAGGEDTHHGYHGCHARSRSKSKLPLVDLFTMMGLSHNHPEGKRREEKVMSILVDEGFELGHKTFIRDLDEPERKRIMGVVIEETKEWGYDKELLEIIVHRGVYARMQSQLRRRRRMDQRQRTRGAHRLPVQSTDSRHNNDS